MARKRGMQFIPYDYEAAYNKGCRNKHFVDLQQLQASLEKQWGVF